MFYLHPKMIVQGAVLWLTGPALAALVTTDLKEQASIWCFFSIAQIAAMLMVVRGNMVDAAAQKKAKAAAKIRFTWYGWPLGLDSNKRK